MVTNLKITCAILAAVPLTMTGLSAADLVDYHVGDRVAEDVVAPVAFEVIDPQATATQKFEEALKTPAIFRYYPETGASVEKAFAQLFSDTHSNFVAALDATFHAPKVGDEVINSQEFGSLLAAFNAKYKQLPVSNDLAADWAHGNDGQSALVHAEDLIQNAYAQPIRTDELPEQFLLGETLRLVPVATHDERLTPDTALQRGKLALESSVLPLSQVENQLRKQFSADQQPFARALAACLRANCNADAPLTDLVRSNATHQLTVARHYDAGQVIIHRGDIVDATTKAAIDGLNERLMPGLLSQQLAAEHGRAEQEEEKAQMARLQALQASKMASQARDEASQARDTSANLQAQARRDENRNRWIMGSLGAFALLAVGMVGWFALRRNHGARRQGEIVPVVAIPAEVAQPVDIAPQVAQAVRDAVVQEMALQRRELMLAQQMASDEIADLVERLDLVQAPMQERLRAYESQITRLENELAVRTEENRELLKMKIDLMRRQMEYERIRTSGEWQSIDGVVRN